MGNFGLNASVPWRKDTEGALCFICKEDIENTDHFLLDCPQFKESFESIWRYLDLEIMKLTRQMALKFPILSRNYIVNIK